MQNKKCIPIKKRLVEYMCKWFSEFLFEGGTSQFYAFRRGNPDGIYDHIIVQREFFEGTISLVITEVASCYNKSWKGIPWFTIGYGTDIGVLITGKNCFDADTGWHRCKNEPEELQKIFDGIRPETKATKALMQEPVRVGLSEEALRELITEIFRLGDLEKEALFDFWMDFLEIETGIDEVMDYLFTQNDEEEIVYAPIDEVIERIQKEKAIVEKNIIFL